MINFTKSISLNPLHNSYTTLRICGTRVNILRGLTHLNIIRSWAVEFVGTERGIQHRNTNETWIKNNLKIKICINTIRTKIVLWLDNVVDDTHKIANKINIFFLFIHHIDEDIQDWGDVLDVCFWCEEKPISQDFKCQFQAHENNKSVFSNLKSTMLHHSVLWRFEHHWYAG